MFFYLGELQRVQFYELPPEGQYNGVGRIASNIKYENGMYIPDVGTKIRFDSGEMEGIYEVKDMIFNDSTGTLIIHIQKI